MHSPVQLRLGKRIEASLMATSDEPTSSTSRRLFITDQSTGCQFLIDTGADLCVFPRSCVKQPAKKTNYYLCAANDSNIATYGTITLTLNLGLRRAFTWSFVVADVSKAIIGVDFLAHYELLVDIANSQLINKRTHLESKGVVRKCKNHHGNVRLPPPPFSRNSRTSQDHLEH